MPTSRTVTLTADTVEVVDLGKRCFKIEVYNDGAAAIYFSTVPEDMTSDTTNFPLPTVGGDDLWHLPAESSSRVIPERGGYETDTIVRLISSGAPTVTITDLSL